MMTAERLRYYRAAARATGVPEMWEEDAAQDIALRCWLADDGRSIVVSRAAIDAARRYGRHGRSGCDRMTVEINEHPLPVTPWPAVDWCLDHRAALRTVELTPKQRRALERYDVSPVSPAECTQRKRARQRLMEYLT